MMRLGKWFIKSDIARALHGGDGFHFFELLEVAVNRGATDLGVDFAGFAVNGVRGEVSFLTGHDVFHQITLRAKSRRFVHK